ncbi:hypothetical protein [Alicyclobacillus tolerans]|uniref:Uncharacterized protein n=1 Tax=Alicyclobacillus tolerans TaxID=90970 RepID=A0A1M6TL29_9BACL|nr:hypothetical protein [Alicyclobacillus montanus]SHK57644.1 hypothetical protein SAMN05443507_1175 [Alicyclobacillus montanus]
MYFMYQEETNGLSTTFERRNQVALAGNRSGLIVQYLRQKLSSGSTEPFEWYVHVSDLIRTLSLDGNALVIDVKPNSKELLTLFKIQEIVGLSSNGWTPILLKLQEILVDEDVSRYDRTNFTLNDYQGSTVYTFLYLMGTVKNGEIIGQWTFPRPGSTNSVLLWRETWEYFNKHMTW